MVDILKEGKPVGFFTANRPIEFVADLPLDLMKCLKKDIFI